jgi:hypothetical protein
MAYDTQPMSPDASKPGMMGSPMPPDGNSDPDMDNDTHMPGSVEIPLESFGDSPPAEGSTVRLKIVSVNQDSGMVMAQVMPSAPKRGRGIKEAASEFEPGGM